MKIKFIQSMLNTLRYGTLARYWPYLSYGAVRLLGPCFAALLSARTIDWGTGNDEPVVLCLFRESFVKDIHEMRQRTDMKFAVVMGGFTRFQEVWFPKAMQIQTYYQGYFGPGRDRALAYSRLYAMHLLRFVERKRAVSAVLSANFDYWQDVGFKQVCKEKRIPFVVLSREHPVVPSVCDIVIKWYVRSAYVFDGALIAVAGDSSKEVLARIGTVCGNDQVVVTGLPRFDAWRDVDCALPLSERKYITLLTFTEGYFADQSFVEVLNVFLQAAQRYQKSEIRFLIKTKDAHDQHLVQQLIPHASRSKVLCAYDVDLFKVLPQSRCVVGYNSLSMVEAAMAGSQLVIPAWGECLDRGSSVMYSNDDPIVSEMVEFAYGPDDLLNYLDHAVQGNEISRTKSSINSFIAKYVHIPTETTSSERVVESITNAIRDQQAWLDN